MKQPVVGVFFGSRSAEHDALAVAAVAAVIKPLQLAGGYDVLPIYLAEDGRWYADKSLADPKLVAEGGINVWLKTHRPVSIRLDGGMTLRQTGLFGRPRRIDIAFPLLHGEAGEVVAGCELAGIPYVGCSVAAKAIASDKLLTRQVLKSAGIPVISFRYFTKAAFKADPDEWVTRINRSLHYPLRVQPAYASSKENAVLVDDPNALTTAIDAVLSDWDKVLVEEAMTSLTDVILPVMGNDELLPGLLELPGVTGEEFLPASLPKRLGAKTVQTGLDAYRALGCGGMACIKLRVDTANDKVYCDEVEPLPDGLRSHNWNMAGMSDVNLATKLVDLAIERHRARVRQGVTGQNVV